MSTEAKTKNRIGIDHRKKETTTPSQERLEQALLDRLHREGYVGTVYTNVGFAMKTGASRGRRLALRSPDLALVTHGIVIEDDGSAHDGHDKRTSRDSTREHDWADLRFVVIRFSDREIWTDDGLSRVLNEIIALIRFLEVQPNFRKDYGVRRTMIQRRLKQYREACPEFAFEPGAVIEPAPSTRRGWSRSVHSKPYKSRLCRGGRMFRFDTRGPRKSRLKPN